MDFKNQTPFPALAFQGLTPEGERFHVAVLRQTFTFANGALVFADQQSPLVEEDLFEGKPNQSSVLAESDLCPFKPCCDIILNATAHAPGGQPVRTFPVRLFLQVPGAAPSAPGLVDKTLHITGASHIRRRNALFRLAWWTLKWGTFGIIRRNPWKQTGLKKVLSLPVRYEYSFGGEAKVLITDRAASRVERKAWLPGVSRKGLMSAHANTGEAGILALETFRPNPIGKSFVPEWHLRAARIKMIPAPQIHAPGMQFTARQFLKALKGKLTARDSEELQPQGFGILAKSWSPRASLLGTVDETFIKSGKHLPEDFDFAYWNGAPVDQQTAFLKGNEVFSLINLCSPNAPGACRDAQGNTVLHLALPGHRPLLLVRYEEGEIVPTSLELDTVILNPDDASLVLVWRCVLPLQPLIRKAEAMMLDREQMAQLTALQEALNRGSNGIGGDPTIRTPSREAVPHV